MAIGRSSAWSAVLTGLISAVIAIPVAWATSSLKPPVGEEAAETAAAVEPTPTAASHNPDDTCELKIPMTWRTP